MSQEVVSGLEHSRYACMLESVESLRFAGNTDTVNSLLQVHLAFIGDRHLIAAAFPLSQSESSTLPQKLR